jgi:ABC-type branched-subunit amino acid transport system ATPase component
VAVNNLRLALRPGEVRGLIGPNGSGKTTTIHLISGLYRADAGEIRLYGEHIDRLRPHEITARGIVRTFQIPKLFGNMSVLENILVPALAALDRSPGRPLPEILERAQQLLEFVTLDRLRHALAKELSGGQSMLLQIARGLMLYPGHLLRVEPGTITGIIGPNGAGKSTVLRTIFGSLPPRQGSILFSGQEIQGLPPHVIKRLGIGYAPQGTNIFP